MSNVVSEGNTKTVESLIDSVSKVIVGFDYDVKNIGKPINTLFDTISPALSKDALELLYNQVILEKKSREYEELITKIYETALGVPREKFGELEDDCNIDEYYKWCDEIDDIIFSIFSDDYKELNLTNIKAKIAEVEKVFREFQKQVIFKDVQLDDNIID